MNLITILFKIKNASPLAFRFQLNTKSQNQISAVRNYEPFKLVDEPHPQSNPELPIIVPPKTFFKLKIINVIQKRPQSV